jgi:arylsulfatase
VLLLDTTRADHIGALGYERDTTPNIDRFARENVLFTRAFTEAPWTPPSVATLFCGLWASSHGMIPATATGKTSLRLDDSLSTMAELLKSAGYHTAAVSANPWISAEFGYAQGFDAFTVNGKAPADEITDAGLAKVDELAREHEPFFLYLHYLDPHMPYKPPAEHDVFHGPLEHAHYNAQMLKSINPYDGEIHYLDASIGKLFDGLRAKHLYDELVIVLLADHGEQFGEHGYAGHGWQLYDEELRVPLIVKPSRVEHGRTSDRVVSILDVLPTVLARAGISKPRGLPGIDVLDDQTLARRPGVLAEVEAQFSQRAFVSAAGMKLIVGSIDEKVRFDGANPLREVIGVFDTAGPERVKIEDAALQNDLERELVRALKDADAARITPTSSSAPSAETMKHLNALGYVK